MTDEELRTLVRDAIARHVGDPSAPVGHPSAPVGHPFRGAGGTPAAVVPVGYHASHMMFAVPAGADADGPCIIEPAVRCNHCGYCKSYGH